MSTTHGDARGCEGLLSALAQGRFAEDPAHWAPHIEACAACRASAHGFLILREHIERARSEAAEPPASGGDPASTVARAFVTYRRAQVRRKVLVGTGVGAVLALGVGALLGSRAGSPSDPFPVEVVRAVEAERAEEPLATALRLQWTVFPREGGLARTDLLRGDPSLRAAFEAALHHPTAAVRRTALSGLTANGIHVDPGTLAEVLRTWNENLGIPLEVAAADTDGRGGWVLGQLERGWSATLQGALLAAWAGAADGKGHVPVDAVLPHLQHSDPAVQAAALRLLAVDPTFRPGVEVESMAADPEQGMEVRVEAAICLLRRAGPRGLERVRRVLTETPGDGTLEARVAPLLLDLAGDPSWLRDRALDPATPLRAALAHALGLRGRGQALETQGLIARALTTTDAAAAADLAELCWQDDLRGHREALQALWRRSQAAWQQTNPALADAFVAPLLVWAERSDDQQHLAWNLEICEDLTSPGLRTRAWVQRVAAGARPDMAERARRLQARWGDT